jgi:hypothetical protein
MKQRAIGWLLLLLAGLLGSSCVASTSRIVSVHDMRRHDRHRCLLGSAPIEPIASLVGSPAPRALDH